MMRVVLAYAAGVVTGWAARSAFGSVRGVAVSAVSASFEASERLRRLIATEREFFEDLIAEGRAAFEAGQAKVRRMGPRAVA